MHEFRFIKLRVYQDAKVFHRKIVFATKGFPREFLYLKDQVHRSALSAVLNIAEGAAKDSDKDFNRYIQNALGSINESAAAIDVAADEKLIANELRDELMGDAMRLKDSLGALSKTLKS